MVTPIGKNFSWGENNTSASLKTAMFWFAEKAKEPSLLWLEKLFFDNESRYKNNRYKPAALVWANDI